MRIFGLVGPRKSSDGASVEPRLGQYGESVVGQAHAKYYEAVSRGRVFSGGTAASGVAPGTAIGTTAAFTLANPAGAKVNLVVLRASVGYVSGTLGAGVIHYVANLNPIAAAVTGTAITAVNALIGSRLQATGLPFTTATLPATPTILRPFVSLGASLASTAVQPWQIVEDVDGEFVIAPGCALSLEGTAAAGSSPLVAFGLTWEEVEI